MKVSQNLAVNKYQLLLYITQSQVATVTALDLALVVTGKDTQCMVTKVHEATQEREVLQVCMIQTPKRTIDHNIILCRVSGKTRPKRRQGQPRTKWDMHQHAKYCTMSCVMYAWYYIVCYGTFFYLHEQDSTSKDLKAARETLEVAVQSDYLEQTAHKVLPGPREERGRQDSQVWHWVIRD